MKYLIGFIFSLGLMIYIFIRKQKMEIYEYIITVSIGVIGAIIFLGQFINYISK